MLVRYFLSTAAVLVAMIFAMNGCGGGGDRDVPQEKVTRLIEAASGGTVSLKNGTTLYIPPYALDQDTNISLSSVDISQFDGDAAAQGGVNGLYIVGAVFEPDGTVLAEPAVVRFPMPSDWDKDETPVLYETQGSNPAEALPSDTIAVIKEINEQLFAEIETSHFSTKIVSTNCHGGTIRRVLQNFTTRGCSSNEIFDLVADNFSGITVDADNAKSSNPRSVQAFIDTFFEDVGTYNKDADIPSDVIAQIKGYVADGRQVVLAFSSLPYFPDRSGTNNFFPSGGYAHTATLELEQNGSVQMYHTITRSLVDQSEGMTKLVNDLGGELHYKYAWDNINKYRTLQAGVAFEISVCGEPGCLDKSTKNNYHIAPYAPLDGVWSIFPGTSTEPRPIAYPSVHIYVEKAGVFTCDDNNGTVDSMVNITVNIPGYTHAFEPALSFAGLGSVNGGPNIYPAITAYTDLNVIDSDLFLLFFSNLLPGPGTYPVSDFDIDAGGNAMLGFSTLDIVHEDSGGAVAFSAVNGTVTLEYYGTQPGERLKGSFSVSVEGVQDVCTDPGCSETVDNLITGTITGVFDSKIIH